MDERKDGWMTCDFLFFSTIFPSYQDDRRMVMNGLRNPFAMERNVWRTLAKCINHEGEARVIYSLTTDRYPMINLAINHL